MLHGRPPRLFVVRKYPREVCTQAACKTSAAQLRPKRRRTVALTRLAGGALVMPESSQSIADGNASSAAAIYQLLKHACSQDAFDRGLF
jgi:hypothetical protein